ncbi:MAG: chromate efflux transporter [Crocinitomicaceae bacterium]|nr:chromate efflux transporter [Crocinitomicaceae bacterium]
MKNNKLKEVALVFLKMGAFAFGGPAAHIAMMEDEIVSKRKWMDRQYFLDLMGATNLIPGPNSTEMTMHCGHERAGTLGLFVAGICFVFPAVIITGFLAWLYGEYGSLPEVEPFVQGIKPIVIALIASAVYKLGKKALKSWELGILGILTVIVSMLGINEIFALLGTGILGMIYFKLTSNETQNNSEKDSKKRSFSPLILLSATTSTITKVSTLKVFLTFLKVGAILYGSGYVLFAYLDAELVTTGLLERQELIDAIAIGQFTPGPVLSTATFIGYQLNGFWGAAAASVGIFLPSFLFVLLLNPLIPKMRKSTVLRYFLDTVNIAAVAIMVVVLFEISKETLLDWRSILIAAIGFLFIFKFKKINVMLVILTGALMGYLLQFI